ncbi:histidine kinase dimerization/phosphoacceptor domain -containing protein [Histidinibacterium aquaticum]|uniref:histidine kinase n=1 Tax=Histidinibacterium aquaticum TaxID=2613962 RepID=A0A5J5GI90_9RHOB|nr:histidine kinase dimerization/phosphoacceptor domain -containing protein [Histidinibacterium aquaticum]KAA9007946.1 hypothetical protein F3S47_10540 [Histidinibacterium aquaticum]
MPDERQEEGRGWGLTFRVIALLSLALLPLGLIAVVQTREYEREALRRSELALLALTERAASRQSELIASARGVSFALSGTLPPLLDDPDVCSEALADVIRLEERFSVIGFLPVDGNVTCSTVGEPVDLRGSETYEMLQDNPRRQVTATRRGVISQEWVVVVTEPVFIEGSYTGSVTVSIPHRQLARTGNEDVLQDAGTRPLQLLTFNSAGDLLSQLVGETELTESELPPGEMVDMASDGARAFTTRSRTGDLRTYAVTPIVPGQVFALGIWEPEIYRWSGLPAGLSAILFPVLMWAMSLIVALLAMHRLVLDHIHKLRSKMRNFGRSRRLVETPPRFGTPSEFREMDAEFMAMAENVLRDEAQLENAVREKNILLKEIHHRVKNNLQLLSSITSMKRRKAESEEARGVLRSLQDRILSLAAIHRNLYLSKDMTAVEAERLIKDILAQRGLTPGHAEVALRIDPVRLVPQQAVPLSLFVAEGLSQGMSEDGSFAAVRLTLTEGNDQMVTLAIEVGPRKAGIDLSDAAVGESLMAAFADQLGGSLERTDLGEGRERLAVRFRAISAVPDAMDY